MPLDDAAGELVGEVAGYAVRLVANVGVELIFNKYVARYFHGVGRHVVMVASFGKLRIPSSLRAVSNGKKAKPNALDWLALVVGVAIWVGAAAATLIFSL